METLTFEQLPGKFSEMFRKLQQIECLLIESKQEPTKPVRVPAPEAAKYLNIALPTLYGLVSQRKIRHQKAGKKLNFFTSDLDDYLNTGRRKTADEMAADLMRKGGRK